MTPPPAQKDQFHKFWQLCSDLLDAYPNRPAKLTRDSAPKKIEIQLKRQAEGILPVLCASDHWRADASVGKGNWASVPWVAIFDSRESISAQQGVYPVIHLSPAEPIGIRVGLGVSATEFKSQADEKASDVYRKLTVAEREELSDRGFTDVINTSDDRIKIGSGKLARKYAQGMIFERFVPVDQLRSNPEEITSALESLVTIYKTWVDRKQLPAGVYGNDSFLTIMQTYATDKIVFLSPKRDARYFIRNVDEQGCYVERLDSDKAERVTASDFQGKCNWLRNQGGAAKREELDNTVARHMCYLQSSEMCLAADRRTAILLTDTQSASESFISLIRSMQTATLYKPVILALVIEAVRDGELSKNQITFDWLLSRFLKRLGEHGQEVSEQQLAEGFGRMAFDLFWLFAHRDPGVPVSSDKPTASQIRQRISYARLHEAFWNAIQDRAVQNQVLSAISEKWWPDMNNEGPKHTDLGSAVEELIQNIAAEGFVFHPWQIATYITALRTKPFVILAGVSGTGKSKLPSLVAKLTRGKCERISVRPDWTDSSDVLGYVDIQSKFRPGVFLQTARKATHDADCFHVSLIDEMNLARVEHYFAEVLSTIEDRQKSSGGGYESGSLFPADSANQRGEWATQNLPANLGIVGTVNMDESSHGFSRKVLDRAFTIELSEVDLSLEVAMPHSVSNTAPTKWPISFWHCPAIRLSGVIHSSPAVKATAEAATDVLQKINACLLRSQLQVGYRTRDEVILFLLNATEVSSSFRTREGDDVDPLDLAIMMKVLPRLVGGSNAIRSTLIGLLGLAKNSLPFEDEEDANQMTLDWVAANRPDALSGTNLPRTAARLCLMWDRLVAEGYTSFWL